jgi:CDP-diglyceride synthetase
MRAPAAPLSKRARIVQRTVVGAGIAGAVVALLAVAARDPTGWSIAGAGLALSALCCFELAKMGSFARQGWALVLAPCWLLVASFSVHTLQWGEHLRSASGSDTERLFATSLDYTPYLTLELTCVVLLATAIRGGLDALGSRRVAQRASSILIAGLVVGWAWLFFDQADPKDWDSLSLSTPLLFASLLAGALHFAWRSDRLGALVQAGWIAALLTLPLPWMWHVWHRWGDRGLIALIVLSKIGDVAGYYVGSAIGRFHPFPHISPGKTIEGCLGSLAAGTAAGGLLAACGLLPRGDLGIAGGLLAGAVTNLAAQAGDLCESWIKRRAGVKDAGTWFGPSGGVLDLVDSLLFTVPAALLFWPAPAA